MANPFFGHIASTFARTLTRRPLKTSEELVDVPLIGFI